MWVCLFEGSFEQPFPVRCYLLKCDHVGLRVENPFDREGWVDGTIVDVQGHDSQRGVCGLMVWFVHLLEQHFGERFALWASKGRGVATQASWDREAALCGHDEGRGYCEEQQTSTPSVSFQSHGGSPLCFCGMMNIFVKTYTNEL